MYRPRGGTNHMTSTATVLGESPNDRNSQRRRRGPRFCPGKGSNRYRDHRPHARKPENSHSYGDSFSVPQWPRQLTKTLTLSLYPRTITGLWSFRRLPAVEADIGHYRNVQYHQQHPHQQHDQYRDKNINVKVKVDEIPISEMNGRERREEAEENQEKLQTAYRQRLWLRQQVGATGDAEQNILMRLGELHVETRCRDRWRQVERERLEMLHASEPRYHGFGPVYTPYQQSPWYQNTDQNTPLYPDMCLYQPGCHRYNDTNTIYNQVLPPSYLDPGSSAIFSEYDCGGQQNHGESVLIGAQNCGSLNEHADGCHGICQPASYQAGRGQEDHMGEADKKWIGGGMGDRTWGDWRLWPGEVTDNGQAHEAMGYGGHDRRSNISTG
ncbi:hypothetical protein F4782DRAFT_552355 [Xylaria castorea]|nr:hypothetical protein F4782DRAFT_552355 [Xylaria castorea]